MQQGKTFFVSSLTALAAYISPIQDIFWAILWVFLANLAAGIVAGVVVNDERFDIKKALYCMGEVAVFYMLISGMFTVGDHMKNNAQAIQAITMITYAFFYFYATNISKNLTRIFPGSKFWAFIYYILSVEFIKRIPYLKAYQEQSINKNNG